MQLAVHVVAGRQAAGDKQRIAPPRAEQLCQLAFAAGLVVGTGDQQLIATGAGALFEQLGNTCVTGVFQVRQDKTQGARVPTAQPCRLGVGRKAMGFNHRAHPFDGCVADALLLGLAIDDVACGGYGHTGQTCDITEFQTGISLFFGACPDILSDRNRLLHATNVSAQTPSGPSRMRN